MATPNIVNKQATPSALKHLQEKPADFIIVGLGASAGGVKALQEFFRNVPANSNMAYVVILHLSPDHDSQLAAVLQHETSIPVSQVTERTLVETNHIYVVSPNHHLVMEDNHIGSSANIHMEDRRAPVDIFFRTLGDLHGPRSICVVLSGTGANGSMGLKRIKERGGAAFVQDPQEAEFSDMPRNAIATQLVDKIMNVADIPGHIIAYRDSINTVQVSDESGHRFEHQDRALHGILTQLKINTGHDFSNYKKPTLIRRIERRINVHNLPDLAAYAAMLHECPEETKALLKDLLISVTNFFRDSKAFDELAHEVLPLVFARKSSANQIRIWVAGCATGEEAYSLAILCMEQVLNVPNPPKIQIFATDIDETAISKARVGRYSLNDAADVSPDRLRRFFTPDGDGVRVRKEIREMILFANHNVLKDPPFFKLDLISCRNVLIYLNSTAQERVVQTFHFALRPKAYLFLGTAESVTTSRDMYLKQSPKHHIFQAKEVSTRDYTAPVSIPQILLSQKHLTQRTDEQESLIKKSNELAPQLEEELISLRTQLRNSIEQLKYQAEELRASNEELQGRNEELRSAAEELETSKEELQSINEELRTVNQELKVKIEETSIASNNLQNLINSANVATIFLDRSFSIRLFTPAILEIFNLNSGDYGRPFTNITNKLMYGGLVEDAESVLEKLTMIEREVTTTDSRYFLMRLLPYRTSENRINGVVITFVDITHRKISENALRELEENYRIHLERNVEIRTAELQKNKEQYASPVGNTPDVITRWDRDLKLVFANAAFKKIRMFITASSDLIYQMSPDWSLMYVLESEEFLLSTDAPTASWMDLYIPADEQPGVWQRINQAIAKKDAFEMEHKILLANGNIGWASSRAVPLINEQGDIQEWFGIATNITARRDAETLLKKMEAKQQQQIFRVTLRTQEEERRRISESLHNGLGQLLFGIKINMNRLNRELAISHPEQYEESKTYTSKMVTSAIEESRKISHELMPMTLEEFGLQSAINDVIRQLQGQVKYKFIYSGPERRLDKYLELAIFRTVQELLFNVAKHSNASESEIIISVTSSTIQILVNDNGTGMPVTEKEQQGIGLSSIRSKIKLLNGTFSIKSAMNKGSQVIVEIPINSTS